MSFDPAAMHAAKQAQATATAALAAAQAGGNSFLLDAEIAAGNATTATKVFASSVLVTQDLTNPFVILRAETAPVGGPLTVALTRNGKVVATLSLPAGEYRAYLNPTCKFYRGDLLNVNVTAVGTTTAGAGVGITVSAEQLPYVLQNAPGLLAYYDLTAQGLSDGAAVPALSDRYGSVNLSKVGSGALTYRANGFGTGFPAVELVAGSNVGFTRASPLAGLSEFTLAIPFRPTQTLGDNYLYIAELQAMLKFWGSSRLNFRLSNNNSSWTTNADTGALTTGTTYLIITRVSAVANKAQVEFNGTSQVDTTFSGSISSNSNALGIGSYFDGGTPAPGLYGAPVILDRYLAGGDLSRFRTALGATVGLTL